MQLKHTIYALPVLLGFAICTTSCEQQIDPDNRFLPVEDSEEPARYVLIEEYTGIDCKNCPDGHQRLAEIEAFYNTAANVENGAGVISVGIHIPVFGDPIEIGGFVTPEASALAPGQNTAPAARINRRSDVLDIDRWQTAVATEIVRKPAVKFQSLKAEIKDGKLSVSGTAESDVHISDARLQVWVVEDDIIDYQLQSDGTYDAEYNHHAVYRCSLTGLEGQAINLNRLSSTDFELTDQTIPSVCNTDNLRVVAFVETTEAGVLNVSQTNVINN